MHLMNSGSNRLALESLTPVAEIDLRALSEAKTEEDTFLSIYLNMNTKNALSSRKIEDD